MSITLRDGFLNESLDRVLEDLLVRFVINCPDEDLSSIERVFFQIEEAQWFYADFIRQLNPVLPSLKMKGFSTLIIERCPMIWRWGSASDALARFGKYKSTIPVRGAALLNKNLDKMLLVKGTESNSWGFPRGKISKDEEDVLCAIREVKEETGFDCTDLIDAANYLERTIRGKNYKIFIIDGVPEDYNFEPLARNEISEIAWKDLKYLNKTTKSNSSQFFLVSAMIKPIMRYVASRKGKENQEEIKRRVAAELKLLLGVSPGTLTEKADIDPGRDLLDQLKAAIKAKPSTEDGPLAQLPISQPLAIPQVPSGMGFQPFFPFPLHNGLPMPFSPNMIHPGHQFPPPHFYPPHQQLPPLPPQLHNFNHQHPMLPIPPQLAIAPTPESLHKPSFSLVNQRSKEADSKVLLGILNKEPSTEQTEQRPVLQPFGDKEMVDKSKSNFLLDLFNKNMDPSRTDKKITLLKREKVSEEPLKKISIMKRPESEGSNDLLSLLKKPDEKTSAAPENKVNGYSNNNAGKELMAMLEKSESHSRPLTPGDNFSSTANGDSKSSEDADSYDDFEDFEELDTGAEMGQSNLLHYDHSDEEYEYESSEESDVNEEPSVTTPHPINNDIPKKKIQILKRSDAVPESQSNSLLSLLQKKPETPTASEGQNNSKSLLNLLQRNSSQVAPSSSASPLSATFSTPQPPTNQEQESPSMSLLSLLKKPAPQSSSTQMSNMDDPAILSSAGEDLFQTPKENSKDNSFFQSLLGTQNSSSHIVDSNQTSSSQNGSSELLNILRRQ